MTAQKQNKKAQVRFGLTLFRYSTAVIIPNILLQSQGFSEALPRSTDTVFAVSRPEAAAKTVTEEGKMLNITAHLHYAKRFYLCRRFDTGHLQKAYRYSLNAPPKRLPLQGKPRAHSYSAECFHFRYRVPAITVQLRPQCASRDLRRRSKMQPMSMSAAKKSRKPTHCFQP